MDVSAENRGRLHPRVGFPAAPVMERNFLTPGHPGVRVGNVHRNSDQKVYVYVVSLPRTRTMTIEHLQQTAQEEWLQVPGPDSGYVLAITFCPRKLF